MLATEFAVKIEVDKSTSEVEVATIWRFFMKIYIFIIVLFRNISLVEEWCNS
jgi:hypothetical protein